MKLAVVSDLHCHSSDGGQRESFVLVGDLRRPVGRHPVEALLRLVGRSPVAGGADVLLVPGDLANKCSQPGLAQSWDHVLEIGSALKVQLTVPVLGNHDVDSRKISHKDPVHVARFLRDGFPFASEAACNSFFAQGFCVLSTDNGVQLVILNSVIDHHDEQSAKRGAFKAERIDTLRDCLRQLPRPAARIAVMHHHPLLHSDAMFSDEDVIETGDAILDVLRDAGCELVIHGHKHVARLRYHDSRSGRLAVFASGSFAAILREVGSFTRNLFHMIELEVPATSGRGLRGEIHSWEWQLGTGWVPATIRSSGFPFRTGFGAVFVLDDAVARLERLAAESATVPVFDESQLLAAAPDTRHFTPSEFALLKASLRARSLLISCDEATGYQLGRLYSSGG